MLAGCIALGLTVKHADVRCAAPLVTVKLPAVQQQDVPCDTEEREAR